MIKSMTGFASATGAHDVYSWSWELRSVNGKGLDLRLRVPDWIDGLEVDLRKSLAAVAARGNVTLSLRVMREDSTGQLSVNTDMLASILTAMAEIEEHAMDRGVSLAPSKASDIAAMRGVLDQTTADQDTKPLAAALIAQSATVIQSFDQMRQSEGAALDAVMHAQLSEIETLTAEAATIALARLPEVTANLRRNIANVMDNVDGVDEQRIAQELALLAVKSDVTEEIDRLGAHVTAARDLLAAGGAVGRKLDFLMQEFNREANTLCSKAQNTDLTRVGLALKALIDQMREQVQNVE
ncbi:YicC/YloC family endoribonuclease [Pseudosulfitobacter sp. SM2401]|uniref:YicC/YloC family endoribonuclease n=1 Tax=Pseudosulfitobacter sp. SM2401 TaxID=3350098 RepID=UPI0036F1C45F